MAKLALAMIVKDETEAVWSILQRYAGHFDEIALAVDYKFDEFEKMKETFPTLRVYQYKWINDFAHKRNWLAERVESEYYMRIDTDDAISHPEKLRGIFEKMVKNDVDVVYFEYIYARDIDGNVPAAHWRESIIKKRPDLYWKKRVHENIFIENQDLYRGVKDDTLKIIHEIDEVHALSSERRNWEILMDEFRQDGEKTDPRTIAYIGRMLVGSKKYKEAVSFLQLLIMRSGWDDDKYFAYIHLSQCYQQLNQLEDALSCCYQAMEIKHDWPDAYLRLGELYIAKAKFNNAIGWIELGVQKKVPDTMFVLDKTVYGYRAKVNLAIAYFGAGHFEKAYKVLCSAQKDAPSNEFIKSNMDMFRGAYENEEYFKHLYWVVGYTKDKDPQKMKVLVNAIPKQMMKDERILTLVNMHKEPYTWDSDSVVIFCGPTPEDWAPPSVLTGIGGSEEAVIYLSKELKKLGKKVTVFCSCADMAGEYEGVTYRDYFEFNPRDNYNVLISWRHNIFTAKVRAKRAIVWMHDVPWEGQFPKDCLENIHKIVVLSKYHRTLLPEYVPDNKVYISSNGINLADFNNELLARNPKRIIYTSSYDRGLQHLLEMWPEIHAKEPQAELHVFYGWNTYDAMVAKGVRDVSFKKQMLSMMNIPGVFEHGRVGHKQLAKEFAKSGIYAYPCHFEEISCISAMKAQASGCVPVTTNYGALNETVRFGVKIDGKAGSEEVNQKFKEELMEMLHNVDKQERIRTEMYSAKETFGWNKVAEKWVAELFV